MQLDAHGVEMTSRADFWKDYRRCTGSLTWRLATPDDLPRIRRLRNISERFLGMPQRDIPLFSMPVLLTLVAENERGKIVDCLYLETQVEVVKIGCDAGAFEESAGLEADISKWLRSIGIKTVLVTTTERTEKRMASFLHRLCFHRVEAMFRYWKRRL